MKDFIESKIFIRIIWGIGIFLAVLVIFQAGVFFGYRKATFSYRLGDNYHRAFGDERGGGPLPPGGFSEAHGVAGKIIKISLPSVFVEGNDSVEKTVLISSSTLVREFRQMISSSDLEVNDEVVIIGSPDSQGQINAALIRVIPPIASSTIPVTQ